MNVVFCILSISSLCALIATSPEKVFPIMLEGVSSSIALALKLLAVYCVWLSVLKMIEQLKLDRGITRLLRPIIKRLFKGESEQTYQHISVNLASNMLGMGGAATPAGIRAIASMARDSDKASDNMILLVIINATSIQLIPATVIALRASHASQNAASILLPTLIASTISTLFGIAFCKLLSKSKKCNNDTKQTLLQRFAYIKSRFCKKHKSATHG